MSPYPLAVVYHHVLVAYHHLHLCDLVRGLLLFFGNLRIPSSTIKLSWSGVSAFEAGSYIWHHRQSVEQRSLFLYLQLSSGYKVQSVVHTYYQQSALPSHRANVY